MLKEYNTRSLWHDTQAYCKHHSLILISLLCLKTGIMACLACIAEVLYGCMLLMINYGTRYTENKIPTESKIR